MISFVIINDKGDILVEYNVPKSIMNLSNLLNDIRDLMKHNIESIAFRVNEERFELLTHKETHKETTIYAFCLLSPSELREEYFGILRDITSKFLELYGEMPKYINEGNKNRFTGFVNIIKYIAESQKRHRNVIEFNVAPSRLDFSSRNQILVNYIFRFRQDITSGHYFLIEINEAFPSSILEILELRGGVTDFESRLIASRLQLNPPITSITAKLELRESVRGNISEMYFHPTAKLEFIDNANNIKDKFFISSPQPCMIVI